MSRRAWRSVAVVVVLEVIVVVLLLAWCRPAPTCTEDMSCWDCREMGNRQCEPTLDADRWPS